ncbi:cache domain-containing protein [Maridesulfovibrio frigidus]|uniref:cache domain-containing protein n=1 Tax=Maridesulfovibrio frigidus TaxID=340956 RepID=UPI000AD7FBE9|nr:cache domain-containing protein [Maridesulfovibrio frigidus]
MILYFLVSNYQKDCAETENVLMGNAEENLKNEMFRIQDYINFSINTANTVAANSVKAEVNEAEEIATHLFNTYKEAMSQTELKQLIKEALRNLTRKNKIDYTFILDMEGTQILSSNRPELEQTNVLLFQAPDGSLTNKAIIDLAVSQKEGFINRNWSTSGAAKNTHSQLEYIKYFAPFNWILGTGQDYAAITEATKKDVLKRLSLIRLSRDGYIFAGSYDGTVFLGPAKGQNPIEMKESNAAQIMVELIDKAKAGGGFLRYTIPSIDSSFKPIRKLSYCLPINDWGWYFGAGSNISLLEKTLQEKHEKLFEILLVKISATCALFLLLTFAAFFFTETFKKVLTNNFDSFERFFRKGTDSPIKIDRSQIAFKEFDQMAVLANTMIDSRESARKDLLKSEITYREIFNSTKEAIGVLDIEKRVFIDVNQAFLDFFGLDRMNALGMSPEKISFNTPPYDNKYAGELFHKALLGEAVDFEWMVKDAQGKPFWTDNLARVATIGGQQRLLIVMRDITERKKMQEIMIQTEKMMSVGGLAAGMAHEINNPLGVILQVTQNIIRRTSPELPGNIPIAEECGIDLIKLQDYMENRGINYYLTNIQEAGARAATIVKSMLDFSRKSNSAKSSGNIEATLENALALASNDYDLKKQYDFKKIKIIREYENPPPFRFTEMEIGQVFLNLIKNAAQALSESSNKTEIPTIIIRTSVDNSSVHIEIEDNGPGISARYLKRVFEPFYSTKAPGTGTGLGLSVSYFIITHNHSGTIKVDSNLGEGTRFTITLPFFSNSITH